MTLDVLAVIAGAIVVINVIGRLTRIAIALERIAKHHDAQDLALMREAAALERADQANKAKR